MEPLEATPSTGLGQPNQHAASNDPSNVCMDPLGTNQLPSILDLAGVSGTPTNTVRTFQDQEGLLGGEASPTDMMISRNTD